MSEYGHQFDQPVRKLAHCQSLLDQAYYVIKDLDLPELKKQIDAALNSACHHAIMAEDEYREKN